MAAPAPYVTGVHLTRTDENVAEIAALREVVTGRHGGSAPGLEGLLGDLKFRARRAVLPRLLGRAVDHAFAWDRYDSRDPRWWPQGISSSADADESELVHGRPVLVATWYAKDLGGGGHGARVTFLDLATLRYRHVLLVVPTIDRSGELGLAPLKVHAGGVVWAGDHLHVAATSSGFVTARVDDVLRVGGDDDERPEELGVVDGRFASYGHRYVLPVRFRYRAHADEGHARLRHSFLSLDRRSDPPGLLAGEYGRGGATTRLARYDLDPGTWLLSTGDDGWSRPFSLAEDAPAGMQGAVIADGRHHLTVSHGPWAPGSVYAGRPGAFTHHRAALPMGPEDLTWWPSTDLLWTVTEHPRRRWVVAMRRSRFD